MSGEDELGVDKFSQDFISGCLSFLLVAMMIRGDSEDQTPEEKLDELMSPLVGNRNKKTTEFLEIMPELYKKVIEYCQEAVNISDCNEAQSKERIA